MDQPSSNSLLSEADTHELQANALSLATSIQRAAPPTIAGIMVLHNVRTGGIGLAHFGMSKERARQVLEAAVKSLGEVSDERAGVPLIVRP